MPTIWEALETSAKFSEACADQFEYETEHKQDSADDDDYDDEGNYWWLMVVIKFAVNGSWGGQRAKDEENMYVISTLQQLYSTR